MNEDSKPSVGAAPSRDEDAKLKQINSVFIIFIFLGLVASILCAGLDHAATVVIWALASLTVGAFVGLLFGIPRIRKKPTPTADAAKTKDDGPDYEPEINNNLIEVSDWLTKIIVGLGLVELGSMPETLKRISRPLATCLNSDCGMAVAVGVIIFFVAAGFLAGYINARTFIAGVFTESDNRFRNRMRELEKQVSQTTAQQATNSARIEGIRAQAEASVTAEPRSAAKAAITSNEPDADLLRMAKDYEGINDNAYRIRVAKKEQAAAAMLRYIVKARISKQALLSWINAKPSDGLVVAFASYVLSSPQPEDLAMLLSVGAKAEWLHVKYRVILALRSLASEGYGSSQEWKDALKLLKEYQEHARKREDASLMNLTQETMDLIRGRLE